MVPRSVDRGWRARRPRPQGRPRTDCAEWRGPGVRIRDQGVTAPRPPAHEGALGATTCRASQRRTHFSGAREEGGRTRQLETGRTSPAAGYMDLGTRTQGNQVPGRSSYSGRGAGSWHPGVGAGRAQGARHAAPRGEEGGGAGAGRAGAALSRLLLFTLLLLLAFLGLRAARRLLLLPPRVPAAMFNRAVSRLSRKRPPSGKRLPGSACREGRRAPAGPGNPSGLWEPPGPVLSAGHPSLLGSGGAGQCAPTGSPAGRAASPRSVLLQSLERRPGKKFD